MTRLRWPALLAAAAFAWPAALLAGDVYGDKDGPKQEPMVLPKPADVQTFTVAPEKIALQNGDDAQQLVVTAGLAGGRFQDLTGDVQYTVADEKVAKITSAGRILPVGNGATTIQATYGDKMLTIPVTAVNCDVNLPINFGNQVVPIFTKLGCNSGGCHGKASGQNGFKISLLGFDPELDYNAMVKEARGRRVFPAAPDSSLLLLKASGGIAHGGGKRMEVGSDEYRLIRRWIAAGTPFGKPTDPVVTNISVFPEHRIMTRNNKQQFAVYAHYSDGSIEDVTRRAQYESNDQEIAVVDGAGLVRTLQMSGEAAIMVRYQSHVSVFRATVPLGLPIPAYAFEPQTVVDQYTSAKWKELGLVPSELCTDEQFIRRISLDLTGTLPTPAQVTQFIADPDPNKRDRLVDALVDSPEYSYYFANKWADILRVKRRGQQDRARGTFAFHDWIRDAIADRQALRPVRSRDPRRQRRRGRTIRRRSGTRNCRSRSSSSTTRPRCSSACVWRAPSAITIPTRNGARTTTGASRPTSAGSAARRSQCPASSSSSRSCSTPSSTCSRGNVINKRTGKPAVMKPLDGQPVTVGPDDDPRQKLVGLDDGAGQPVLRPGRGQSLLGPLLRPRHRRSAGRHARDQPAVQSRAARRAGQGLGGEPLQPQAPDQDDRARAALTSSARRPTSSTSTTSRTTLAIIRGACSAEVLFDAVNQVADSPATFNGLPTDRYRSEAGDHAAGRVVPVVLPGRVRPAAADQRLRVRARQRGQPGPGAAPAELGRDPGQAGASGGRAEVVAKDPRPDGDKVDELFLWALGRKPTPEQRDLALANIAKNAANKKAAYENILWALLNTKEFVFNK